MHKGEYNFCFRGDNHITNKVRVVSLACDMPTGLPLYPYQILSNYLKQYKGQWQNHASNRALPYQKPPCLHPDPSPGQRDAGQKNHDFIHVNSTVAGKYYKYKPDDGHLRFPIRTSLTTVDLQVTSILSI